MGSDGLGELLAEFRAARERYGPIDEDTLIDTVQSSIASRRARLDLVRRQMAELEIETRWLQDEIVGRQRSLELLIRDVLRRIGRVVEDAWSPVPVLGFRMWTMRPSGLQGAKVTWKGPEMRAECLTTGGSDDVPHVDGRCGRLGCGVYATKELPPLLTAHLRPQSHSYAIGLVALSGKVVEHEYGYRAERAQIEALVGVGVDRYWATDDPDDIADLCSAPEATTHVMGGPKPPSIIVRLERYLSERRERRSPWISASNAE